MFFFLLFPEERDTVRFWWGGKILALQVCIRYRKLQKNQNRTFEKKKEKKTVSSLLTFFNTWLPVHKEKKKKNNH